MNKKVMIGSICSITLFSSAIIGGTYAILIHSNEINNNVQTSLINVESKIVNFKTYSYDEEQLPMSFENGGKVVQQSEGLLSLNNMTTGDKVTFDLLVYNHSDIKTRFRILTSSSGELSNYLTFTLSEDYRDWSELEISDSPIVINCILEIPDDVIFLYQGQSASFAITTEAVQYNAFKEVTFVNNDGSVLFETVAPIGGEALYLEEEPIFQDVENNGLLNYYYKFTSWDKELGNITEDTIFTAQYEEIIDTRLRFELVDHTSSI